VKKVSCQMEWNVVARDLEFEKLKLKSYDQTLLQELGDFKDSSVLDYGSGPGVLAFALKKLGVSVKVYDINPEMRERATELIGLENVYDRTEDIPEGSFDLVVCNLVLCIVSDSEVEAILSKIKTALRLTGFAYVGFCNPKIHNVAESQLDFRFFSGRPYEENHSYKKVKKEGVYEIVEYHRPVDWYARKFHESGLILLDIFLTPEYELRGQRINDFTIFKLGK
jgi:SAM-dependent methyltransferase